MIEEIRSQTRKADIVLKRQALCYYLYEYKDYPPQEIGEHINRDRTTVLYSIKTFKERLNKEIECVIELNELKKQNFDLDNLLIKKFINKNKTRLSGKLLKQLKEYE